MEYINNEVELVKDFDCPHILQLKEGPLVSESYVTLVFEHCNQGTLKNYIERVPVSEDLIKQLLQQLCVALLMIHNDDVVMRAITLDTIFVHEENGSTIFKLGDFMFASKERTSVATKIQHSAFIAQEMFQGSYGEEVDIFSLGRLIEALLKRRANSSTEIDQDLLDLPLSFSALHFLVPFEDLLKKRYGLEHDLVAVATGNCHRFGLLLHYHRIVPNY